ncbi:MAG: hypothetical protein EOP37_19500 [Rubrivivax sp.]|nr:MAG: hypothetical protein EOP37_19500 [Rubrivivax sp.]
MTQQSNGTQRSQGRDDLKQQRDSQPSRQGEPPRTADQDDVRGLQDQKDLEDGKTHLDGEGRPGQRNAGDVDRLVKSDSPRTQGKDDERLARHLHDEDTQRPDGKQREEVAQTENASSQR